MAKQVVLECGMVIGRRFNLADIEKIQKTCSQEFKIKAISTQNGYELIAQGPEEKNSSDERDIFTA